MGSPSRASSGSCASSGIWPSSEWHSSIQIEHDHLGHTDLPRFVMDSYEECRDPPRLFLLDKFDSAGPGSGACLRRYSDPTYFKRVHTNLEPVKAEKVQKVRKIHKIKKKLSRLRDGDVQHVMFLSHRTSSVQGTSPGTDGQSIAAETLSTSDMRLKSELGSRSTSFDSRTRNSFVEPALDINSSVETENQDYSVSSASMLKDNHIDMSATATAEDGNIENADADDDFYSNYLEMKSRLGSPSAAWDEKVEIVKPIPKSRFLIDPVVDVNYPLASVEPEHNELSAQLDESHTDAGGANNPEESNAGPDEVDDDGGGSHQDSLLEQHTHSSSSVTWDEKAEIIGPTGNQMPGCDLVAVVQDSDPHSFMPVVYKQEAGASTHAEIDKDDALCSGAGTQAQFLVNNHFDEVISETENYVDALNTLESETETDSEFQTIRELMPLPNSSYQEMECMTDNMQEVGACAGSSDTEDSASSRVSPKKGASSQVSTLVFPGSADSAKAHDDGSSGCSIDNGHEKCNGKTPHRMTPDEAAADNPASHSMIPSSQEVLEAATTTTETQNLQLPKTCDGPIKFWTNGGLLGLEPSKPPDFSFASVVCENSVSNSHINSCDIWKVGYDASSMKSDTVVLSSETKSRSGIKESTLDSSASHCINMHSEVTAGSTHNAVYPDEPSSSFFHSKQNNGRPASKSHVPVPVLPKPEPGKFHEIPSIKIFTNGKGHDLTKADGLHGDEASVSLNGEISSGQRGLSSSLTSLTRRLLTNSLQRKESLNHSDAPAPPDMLYSDSINLQNISIPSDDTKKLNGPISQEILEPNASEKTELGSPGNTISSILDCSGQSSPPLEHMKISFHPINGLETSKLRLEFPDTHLHESIEELMFPSFQLLPGPNSALQGVCSESDDDTFSRSYPYSQEDVSSPHSDLNSDLWAQDEMSGSENHEVHDDSRRFSSSAASISSSLQPEGRKHTGIDQVSTFEKLDRQNGTIAFHSGPCLDLPNLDSLKCPLTQQRGKYGPLSNKSPDCTLPSSGGQPPPPPLPPLQWRTMRPSVQVDDERISSEEISHSGEPQLIRSVALCHPEQELPRPPCIGETGNSEISTKFSENKGLDQAPKGREPDEREDLLHQIRNKTFRLRPTVTSRPSIMPRSTTNVKVAAILEKANAIRQAFASSDEGGDDETWSDG